MQRKLKQKTQPKYNLFNFLLDPEINKKPQYCYLKNSVQTQLISSTMTETVLVVEIAVFPIRNDVVSQKCSWDIGAGGRQRPEVAQSRFLGLYIF